MQISAKLLTVGKTPEADFVGKNNNMVVRFPAAENHNKKEGSEWVTVSTSWYNMEAWGDVAEQVMTELDKGVGFELVSGYHKIDKVDDRYYNKYVITEFKKYERE